MRDFDLDLFWSLPRCEENLTDGNGNYCALGAAGKALGVTDEVIMEENEDNADNPGFLDCLLSDMDRYDIYLLNDKGVVYQDWVNIFQKGETIPGPNHEKAKRLLIEKLQGKVNFITKDVTFTKEKEECKIK